MNIYKIIFLYFLILVLSGCDEKTWNSPYNDDKDDKIVYTSFSERPKHLDPAKSYSSNEWSIIAQIYEPPLQYDYYKRPYVLVPLAASKMPTITKEYDNSGEEYTVYTIVLRKDLRYQPHPSFVPDNLDLSFTDAINKRTIQDFTKSSSREVTASDYVHQIKRIADPNINSPIYGLMSNYILGLKHLHNEIDSMGKNYNLDKMRLEGARVLDRHTYQIVIKGDYPQFLYWLAMPFFSPMPPEADKFYSQEGMSEHNLTLDWYPIGSGPFYLIENDPSYRILLGKNENYHKELFPTPENLHPESMPNQQNMQLPLVNSIIFSLEKESIPYWNKFMQGYYDSSGVSSDNFNNVFNPSGISGFALNKELTNKGIRMQYTISPSTMYWGFNMIDEVVGGYTEDKVKLRQALSLAMDIDEYISIFLNGRAEVAMHPLPPDFLSEKIINKNLYDNKTLKKKDLNYAKKLLAEAGYPNGRDKNTGEQLTIFFEAIGSGDPNERATFSWLRKQFRKIGVELVVRVTDYNRFQDKMKKGKAQMFFWGWNADYPDVENFLFMFYSKNSKSTFGGENASNYNSKKFDALFDKYNITNNGVAKNNLVKEMIEILQDDAPWIWGYHPHSYTLFHSWYGDIKPNAIARNTAKYISVDPNKRYEMQIAWNKPNYLPLYVLLALCILFSLAIVCYYLKRQNAKVKRFNE